MTEEELRELLEDVQTVYEGKGMVVHPSSFDKLRMEVIKLDNVNRLQNEQIEQMKCGGNCKFEYWKNTGGCYDQKCRLTGLDCTNCKDKWKGKWEND